MTETQGHWAAQNGYLTAPYNSDLWRIRNNNNETLAHWVTKNGYPAISYDCDIKRTIVDNETSEHEMEKKIIY